MTTSRRPDTRAAPPMDRRLRIELLRMRAGYERLAVQRSACRVVQSIQPDHLLAQASRRAGSAGLGWLTTGLRLLRRYPMMLSLLSSAVSGARRNPRLLRAGLGAWLLWRWLGRRHPAD